MVIKHEAEPFDWARSGWPGGQGEADFPLIAAWISVGASNIPVVNPLSAVPHAIADSHGQSGHEPVERHRDI